MSPPPQISTHEAIAAELGRLAGRRGGTIPYEEDGALLALACVTDRAGNQGRDGCIAAFAQLLPQVASKLRDPQRTAAALALLSLEGPLQRASPATRRQAAANALGMKKGDSFRRRHEIPLLDDLAQAFVSVEVAHRYRTRERDPERIDWVGRFEGYYRLCAPISGLRGDLEILIRAQREKPGEFDYLIAQVGSSLWFYARFQLELDGFVNDYGGLWLLSDPEAETDIANAVQHINRDPGLTEHDASWLRTALRDSPGHELDPFLEHVSTDPRGQAILGAWVGWCQSCRCPAGPPRRACEVHAVSDACRDYTDTLDRELRQLGQPYRTQLSAVPAEDITYLVKRFGAVSAKRDA